MVHVRRMPCAAGEACVAQIVSIWMNFSSTSSLNRPEGIYISSGVQFDYTDFSLLGLELSCCATF